MRVLVIYANPVETSYGAAVHDEVLAGLKLAGHEIDDLDLYAEGFDPVLSRHERIVYHDVPENAEPVQSYVDRVRAADALVLVYPVWNFGYPAILKGFFDRVLITGVSFELDAAGHLSTKLTNIKKIAIVCTYGTTPFKAFIAGDPPRKVNTRWLRGTTHLARPMTYLALYRMNTNGPKQLTAFLEKTRRTMAKF